MSPDVSTNAWELCDRREARQALLLVNAVVEINSRDGRRRCLRVVNLSKRGLAFALEGLLTPEIGEEIADVIVRVEDNQIHGSIKVAHVTHTLAVGTVCGGRFTPASVFDGRRLETALQAIAEEEQYFRSMHGPRIGQAG